jgi:tetratricopeptide (TPR) repeat protein
MRFQLTCAFSAEAAQIQALWSILNGSPYWQRAPLRGAMTRDRVYIVQASRMTSDLESSSSTIDAPLRVLRGAHTYRLIRKLGEGGQGAVYEAEDLDRGKRVAVKLLRAMNASTVARFKREFRIRERIAHPCLVEYGELALHESQWFFSMSLVSGAPLLAYLGQSEQRLRAAFAQLAEGIAALHAVGVVHRDIKPENILVESDGRLVLLDLGLALDLAPGLATQSVGTPAYMAPEQWGASPLSEAVDWYAFGVILFEALASRRPFEGSHVDLFVAKTQSDAPALRELATGCPADLAELCDGLLLRDAARRFGVHEVLRCFSDFSPERVMQTELHSAIVGRAGELHALEEMLAKVTASGTGALVVVEGDSGIGKTALVRALVERARAAGNWVLTGRCYETESVPFKAFDQTLDNLAAALKARGKEGLARYRPRHAGLLAKVFPALALLQPKRMTDSLPPADPAELKARATRALLELFERMAEDHPVVVCLDDVQWADADSIELLEQLARSACSLLLVVAQRPDGPYSEHVRKLCEASGSVPLGLAPLDLAATRLLAESVSDRLRTCTSEFFERVHRETGGSPFLVCEWARFVHLHGTQSTFALQELLKARIAELAPSRQRLLTVVAVSGEPLDARLASHIAMSDEVADVTGLRRERLVRTLHREGLAQIDVYHDRIRQIVCDGLAPEERREIHQRVAAELELSGAPPERRVASQLAAGDREGAAKSAVEAAKAAETTLAFQRAAEMYGLALELWPAPDEAYVELQVRRADAFQNALRPSLAAEALRSASARCKTPERARDLLRLAGEQFLLSGDLQQGLLVLQQALADHQLSLQPSAGAALLETMTLIAQLTQRGLLPKEGVERDLHAESRVQLCLSIARCLHHVDLRGLPFALRALLEALELGSEALLQQACATFVMVTAGHLPNPMIEGAFEQCRVLTAKLANANAQALLYMAEVEIEHFRGRYTAAERACERAERTLINQCVGVSRELGQIRSTLLIMAHSDRGDFSANAERALGWLEDADRRSDKFYGNWLRAAYSLVWMAQDMPARARTDIARAEAEWPAAKGGTFETACVLYLDALDRYEDLPNVHESAAQGRVTVLESPVVHTPLLQGYLHLHRAWGCLRELGARPKAHSEESRSALRKLLEHSITSLRKLGLPSWVGTADACEANMHLLDGDRNQADSLLERAYGTLADAHYYAFAACARRRLAEVVDGDLGRRWQAEADTELQRLGVVAPARFARAYFSPFSATSYERCSEPTTLS